MSLRAVPGPPPPGEIHPKGNERPWLGVRFTCSGQYQRVYRNAAGTEYNARCLKCSQCIKFRVGGGTEASDQRFFNVSC
ncbi:MAG: hypothetical protein JKY43_11025 [Phycisphaerales bacterium]|nr:hypothetical protein [Phycisphaerales bacterium]